MKKTSYILLLGAALAVFSCSKDPIVTEVSNPVEKPTNPGETDKPTNPTTPTTPNGEEGVDKNQPNEVANFNDFASFEKSLNSFKLQPYAKYAANQGRDGKGALLVNGTPTANQYVFTIENQTVNQSAKTIVLYIKGNSSPKSLSFNVYKADGNYEVFNLRTDDQITNKTDITLTKDIVLKKTTKKADNNPNTGVNNYDGVNINASNWIKITLDLQGIDYNKSGKGSLFALKVGKSGNYNLLFDSITFDDVQPTEPTEPTEPSKPGEFNIPSNIKEYYKTIDFSKSGIELKNQLSNLVANTHKKNLSYAEVWEAIKASDLTPAKNEVYLLYGTPGENSGTYAYKRGKNKNGGKQTDWNREHTYAKSLGTPNLETSGPGADAHHLRAADVGLNSQRGNLLFAKGSGKAARSNNGWYPGNEWKGDVARMMMYMYIRYNTRCLPSNVAIGNKNKVDNNMIDLLLEWNAEDPVSEVEIQRNNYLGNLSNPYAQGNRNPFIDNPYLATQIWGGPQAPNLWK